MKYAKLFNLLFLIGCIQTDFEDPFPPTFRIENGISQIEFRVSGLYPLDAVYTDDTGEPADVPIIWKSSDESNISFQENIAHVHDEGLVIITASANGLEDSRAIETLPSREQIQITSFASVLQIGTTSNFSFTYIDPDGNTLSEVNPIWNSSNTQVATINASGTVSAVAEGSTEISVAFGNVLDIVTLEVTTDPILVDPEIKITSFAMFLDVGEEFQFEAEYFDEMGQVDADAMISWSSSNETILSITNQGLATGIASGSVTVEASFDGIRSSVEVNVQGEVTERSGSLMGTGYDISGNFSLAENENGDLILTVTNYTPDAPGPYFYFTNQNNNVANGLELGDADEAGSYEINISELDESVELSTYNVLMVWCKPFNVRLGYGEFED